MSGTVFFVVPSGLFDDRRVSGGNRYDRHVRDALVRLGREIVLLPVAPGDEAALDARLRALPAGAPVLVDGLVAVSAPRTFAAHADRLGLVLLAHMQASALDPAVAPAERVALAAATRIVATSEWTAAALAPVLARTARAARAARAARGRELDRAAIDRAALDRAAPDPAALDPAALNPAARGHAPAARADRAESPRTGAGIAVARPGANPAPLARGSAGGAHLLCLGTVAQHKGHDLVVAALATLRNDPRWTCDIIGSLDAAPSFVADLRMRAEAAGIAERVRFRGVLTGADLDAALDGADLLLAPSRVESFGMAVSEAVARGIPAVVSDAGGQAEALLGGGVVVPSDDVSALAGAVRGWLADPAVRHGLRDRALRARTRQRPWSETARVIDEALAAAGQSATTLVEAGTTLGRAAATRDEAAA